MFYCPLAAVTKEPSSNLIFQKQWIPTAPKLALWWFLSPKAGAAAHLTQIEADSPLSPPEPTSSQATVVPPQTLSLFCCAQRQAPPDLA